MVNLFEFVCERERESGGPLEQQDCAMCIHCHHPFARMDVGHFARVQVTCPPYLPSAQCGSGHIINTVIDISECIVPTNETLIFSIWMSTGRTNTTRRSSEWTTYSMVSLLGKLEYFPGALIVFIPCSQQTTTAIRCTVKIVPDLDKNCEKKRAHCNKGSRCRLCVCLARELRNTKREFLHVACGWSVRNLFMHSTLFKWSISDSRPETFSLLRIRLIPIFYGILFHSSFVIFFPSYCCRVYRNLRFIPIHRYDTVSLYEHFVDYWALQLIKAAH